MREGESVQAGQVLARIDTADLEAKLIERIGALESAKAQLAMAEKTRATNQALLKQNFISQNAFDNSESSFSVVAGHASSRRRRRCSSRATRCATRSRSSPLAGIVAKRHVQPGEKVAFDSPLVTVVDLKDMELQAAVPAVDVPELAIGKPVELTIDGFGERRFTGRVERINPATEPGTRAILVYVGIPNADGALRGGMFATGRIALAASAPVPTLPATAVRTEAGQTFVWTVEGGKLVQAHRRRSAAATTPPGRVEVKTALPAGRAGARRALRQPEGRRAGDRQGAAARPAPAPASAPTSGRRRPRADAAEPRSTAMWITRVSINNPVFATMVMVGIAVLGLFAYNRLRVEQMPDVSLPFVLVLTSYPGASPEVVETDVTKPLEYAINTVSGVELIRSNSREGQSQVFAEFRMSTDMTQGDAGRARQDRAGAARLPARRQGSARHARRPGEPAAGGLARRAVADDRAARAHVAHRPDDRQGARERPGRGARSTSTAA